jgi:hypothetical protein
MEFNPHIDQDFSQFQGSWLNVLNLRKDGDIAYFVGPGIRQYIENLVENRTPCEALQKKVRGTRLFVERANHPATKVRFFNRHIVEAESMDEAQDNGDDIEEQREALKKRFPDMPFGNEDIPQIEFWRPCVEVCDTQTGAWHTEVFDPEHDEQVLVALKYQEQVPGLWNLFCTFMVIGRRGRYKTLHISLGELMSYIHRKTVFVEQLGNNPLLHLNGIPPLLSHLPPRKQYHDTAACMNYVDRHVGLTPYMRAEVRARIEVHKQYAYVLDAMVSQIKSGESKKDEWRTPNALTRIARRLMENMLGFSCIGNDVLSPNAFIDATEFEQKIFKTPEQIRRDRATASINENNDQ